MSKLYVVLDEVASLGHMSCIEDALDKFRGYGIRLIFFFQSLAQIKKCFPHGQDETLLANTTQVYFAISDNSAEKISQRLGDQTITVSSGGNTTGYSRSASPVGTNDNATRSTGTNDNWSQMARRLLKPEEIQTLDGRVAITFVPGQRPILTWLERYYEQNAKQPMGRGLATLAASSCVLAVAIFCLWSCLYLMEKAAHVGSVQRNRGRSQATHDARVHGNGQRPVQRQRLRPVRPGAVHAIDSRTGEESSGARADEGEAIDGP